MKNKLILLSLLSVLIVSGCNNKNPSSSSSILESTSNSSSVLSSVNSSSSGSVVESSSSIPLTPLQIAKQEALSEFEEYFGLLNPDFFSEEDWQGIIDTYEAGVMTIESAATIPEVGLALTNAKVALDEFETTAVTINVTSTKGEGELLYLFINARLNDVAEIDPVSILSCSLGEVIFVEKTTMEGKPTLVLKGDGLNFNKGEYSLTIKIKNKDMEYSDVSLILYNGYIKNLDTIKAVAINEINGYLTLKDYTASKYSTENWNLIQGYINTAISQINTAIDFSVIDNIVANTKLNIEGTPQSGVTLNAYKTNAKEELENLVASLGESNYHPTNWAQVQSNLSTAKSNIESAATQRDVVIALENGKASILSVSKKIIINLITTNANEYNADFISISFSNLPFGGTYVYDITANGRLCNLHLHTNYGELQLQLPGGVQKTTYTLVIKIMEGDTIYQAEIEMVNGVRQELPAYRSLKKTELEAYVASKGQSNYSIEDWNTIQGYLSAGKMAIDAATSAESVNAIVASVKTQIDGVSMSFANYKTYQTTQITNFVNEKGQGNYSAENWNIIQGFLTTALSDISKATTTTQVDAAVNSAKEKINAIETNYLKLILSAVWNPHGTYFIQFGWSSAFYAIDVASMTVKIKDLNTNKEFNGEFNRYDYGAEGLAGCKVVIVSFIGSNQYLVHDTSSHYYLTIAFTLTTGEVYKTVIEVNGGTKGTVIN